MRGHPRTAPQAEKAGCVALTNIGNMKLTLDQSVRKLKLIKVVDNAEAVFVEAGKALRALHAEKLYLDECNTWDEFCLKRWGKSRAQAYRLMDASIVVEMSPIGDKIINESQARALKDVSPQDHKAVMAAASTKGPATAKSLNEAKNTVLAGAAAKASPDKAPVVRDKIGCPVPDKALKFWNRRQEVQDWMAMISEVKCGIERAFKDKDLLYVHIRQSIIGDLNMIREGLSYALPYAVCTSCQGRLADKCMLCRGTGVLSQQLYLKVPSDVRKMHENKVKGTK
jgi:hypothetical protein